MRCWIFVVFLASAPKKHNGGDANSLDDCLGRGADTNALPEHPRPRMQRDNYVMLERRVEYAVAPVGEGRRNPAQQ